MRDLFRFIIKKNIFVALAAAFFYWAGFIILNAQLSLPPWYNLSLIFFSTLAIYLLNNSGAGGKKGLRGQKIFLVLSSVIILIHIYFLNYAELILLINLGIISLFYNLPLNSQKYPNPALREIDFAKVFLIAWVWASIASAYPVFSDGLEVRDSSAIIVFLAHYFFILSITLPFDIRDYSIDKKDGLSTLPGKLGIRKTKIIALTCLFIFYILIMNFLPAKLPVSGFTVVAALFIGNSTTDKKWYWYAFFLDGLIFLYFMTIIISFWSGSS